MVKRVALGIDLGTTNTCVSYVKNGHPEIIQVDGNGRKNTMPSCVSFTPNEILIGESARKRENANSMNNADSANTITGVKRLMGRKFDDPEVRKEIERRSYTILEGLRGRVKIQVKHRDQVKTFLPEEISAMILERAVSRAKEFLGNDVIIEGVVITVPANFNQRQREATMDAARIAKLNVLHLTNEPTAAAIAYGLKWATDERRNVLVYDFGGGTFDVTVLEMKKGEFTVKAVAGDTHLGGDDIDRCLVDWFVTRCETETGVDITSNLKAFNRLKEHSKKAKELLTNADEASISLADVARGIDFEATITRDQLDGICNKIVKSTIRLVRKALSEANPNKRNGMDVSEVDHVVLVGGSSRLPLVQKQLREHFRGKELNFGINEDEAVAHGAALQAAILHGEGAIAKEVHLVDVAPLSLGIDVQNGTMCKLIKRNTPIPARETMVFTTDEDLQEQILFKVYEGERAKTKNNVFLDEFLLSGITPMHQGHAHVDVIFEVDANGIYHVSAKDTETGTEQSCTIRNDGGLSKEDIRRMIEQAEENKKEDELHQRRLEKRNKLEGLCRTVQRNIDNENFDDAKRENVAKKHREITDWLRGHKQEEPEEYARKYEELSRAWMSLHKKNA